MTKREIERRISEHAKAIKELIKQRETAKDELELKDFAKPFRQWSLEEQNDLNELNAKAFDWFYSGNERTMRFLYGRHRSTAFKQVR